MRDLPTRLYRVGTFGFQAQTRKIFEAFVSQPFSQRDGYQQGFKGDRTARTHWSVGTS